MDIAATGAAPAPAQAATASAASSSVLSSDFETFLRMLTAQAENQDPLEPIDSSEYAAQLAQFSMVEQQVKSNDLLAALTAQLGVSNMASLAGWVGMEARAAAPMQFDGAPITIAPNPLAVADEVMLVVRNEAGQEVQRQPLPLSAEPVEWAGVGADGTPLEAGVYSFTVESYSEGSLLLSETAEVYGQIREAQSLNGEIVLIFEGGTRVPAAGVTGLRAPG